MTFNSQYQPPMQRTNTMALVGFILSVTACCSPGGLIVSIIGLNQIKRDPVHETGRGLAIAGIVISSVTMALAALYFLILVVLAATGNADAANSLAG